MTDRPRLLWHSNAPHASTGYGNQTALFAPRLKEHYELAISAFYGVEGNILPWNGIPVMPGIGQTYGNEVIREHAKVHFGELKDGMVVTLMDVWVLDPGIWQQLNVACWVPIDHQPLPPPIGHFFEASGAVPIAMSRFGEQQLAGLDPLYMPHGVDCDIYYPREEARKATTMPEDAFIVGMVAANKGNPSRKCFHEAFQAFRALHDRHPESKLYLHTEITGRFDGVNLLDLAAFCGIDPSTILLCDQYRAVHFPYGADHMAKIYSSLDVLLMPSAGEGFGIPALESQACGVPVIASDFSAQPEVCGAGWLVSGRTVFTPLKAHQFLPDIEDIVEALESAYGMPKAARVKCAEKARAHAETYHVDRVFQEYMLPALEQARERFEERAPVDVVARARKKHKYKKKVAA